MNKDFIYHSVDGKKMISFTITDGVLETISFSQNDDAGNKLRQIDLDGNLDGVLKLFYPTGVLNKEKEIKGMVAEGKAVTYYPNGAVYVIDEYKNGSLHKASEVFDENGTKISGNE